MTFRGPPSNIPRTICGDKVSAQVNNEDNIARRQLLLLERFAVFQNAAFYGQAPQFGDFGADALKVEADLVHLHHEYGLVRQITIPVNFLF